MNAIVKSKAQQVGEVLLSPNFRQQVAASMAVPANDPVIDRFARVAMRAVQEDPKLLDADRNSLYLACQAAATDGLMPDGREGKLVTYSTRSGNGWIDKVQWQRMVGGIRKLAAKHDFDLIAHVVYEADEFDYEAGIEPRIFHKPAVFAPDRGAVIGVYCIATHLKTGHKYFEVMSTEAVNKIMERSKSKDKQSGQMIGPWKTDWNEMAKKTVAKLLFKSLPLYNAQDAWDVINRDNEEYEAPAGPAPSVAQPAPPASKGRPSALQSVVEQAGTEVIDAEVTEVQSDPVTQPETTATPPPQASKDDEFF